VSAEILRRAASLMRQRAEAATPSPWEQTGDLGSEWDDIVDAPGTNGIVADADTSDENAAHIASWHPDAALAVADWLGKYVDCYPHVFGYQDALKVANAYLGDQP
jgi:hypothetical protein